MFKSAYTIIPLLLQPYNKVIWGWTLSFSMGRRNSNTSIKRSKSRWL